MIQFFPQELICKYTALEKQYDTLRDGTNALFM